MPLQSQMTHRKELQLVILVRHVVCSATVAFVFGIMEDFCLLSSVDEYFDCTKELSGMLVLIIKIIEWERNIAELLVFLLCFPVNHEVVELWKAYEFIWILVLAVTSAKNLCAVEYTFISGDWLRLCVCVSAVEGGGEERDDDFIDGGQSGCAGGVSSNGQPGNPNQILVRSTRKRNRPLANKPQDFQVNSPKAVLTSI